MPPHAPCRLQPSMRPAATASESFASTRSVQIATIQLLVKPEQFRPLPPHAPCRLQLPTIFIQPCCNHFASTRSVQIATWLRTVPRCLFLPFASTRSVQIATIVCCTAKPVETPLPPHAPCRLQRLTHKKAGRITLLCLHTLRADCNFKWLTFISCKNLCLHTLRADCNAQCLSVRKSAGLCLHTLRADCNVTRCRVRIGLYPFASTRSVQIATLSSLLHGGWGNLCLHTLRADCN